MKLGMTQTLPSDQQEANANRPLAAETVALSIKGAVHAAARPATVRALSPAAAKMIPGLLLLLWLPANLAHRGTPPWGGPHAHQTTRCYSTDELTLGRPPQHLWARSAKWEQTLPVTLVSSLEAESHRSRHDRSLAGTQCPALRPEQVLEADIHERSISPWRYRIDTDENRYPQKLAFAECLCRGCISARTGRETAALNSVRLHQRLLVLRRLPCAPDGAGTPQPGAATFRAEFIRVPVGCTCVLPRSTAG
ncbi:interleukin-17C [Orycteropus afer afer]|uniref:Interleukin-17C n=1 Tax=Orycteropus afer afer TaxID=1230840 RepID=A0A8B6ZQN1_ORYAF|nr:interleukin-17C [Orycteropus afer afer]